MFAQNRHNKRKNPLWSMLVFTMTILGCGCNVVPEPTTQETFNHVRNTEPWVTLLKENRVKLKSFNTVASDTGEREGKDTYLGYFVVDVEYLVDTLAWNCTEKQREECPQRRAGDIDTVNGHLTYMELQGRWKALDPVYEEKN